ncbi:transcription elongation factor SPT4 [Citrus sinensis]|uniref:Transcription elongation factor SPT4 n=1 Tax=Citrus sinensis TaxID=2711 RepID=A0ACB8NBN0_CITSI|nr:transcription elongation factor SPT4 [Citrus sinensis]
MGSAPAQIPTSFGHELRACLRCRLVKTYDQFRESGCENCPFFKMDEDHERVVDSLYQSWIQLEAGLLAGCELEDLSLVVILLLSQKPYLRTCRTYAKTSACNMCRQNVNDSLSSALSVKIISVSGYFGDDMFNDYMQL